MQVEAVMSGPVTQDLLIAVTDGVREDAREGHGRLRQSINELKAECSSMRAREHDLDMRLGKIEEARRLEESHRLELERLQLQQRASSRSPRAGWLVTFAFLIKASLITVARFLIGKGNQ